MLVVSDTSPLTALLQVGQEGLLATASSTWVKPKPSFWPKSAKPNTC